MISRDTRATFLSRLVHRSQLLTSSAVHKWGTEIHEGIYNMLMLLVELVAERVKQDPAPVNLMGVLAMVGSLPAFLPRHSRSRHRFVSVIVVIDSDLW